MFATWVTRKSNHAFDQPGLFIRLAGTSGSANSLSDPKENPAKLEPIQKTTESLKKATAVVLVSLSTSPALPKLIFHSVHFLLIINTKTATNDLSKYTSHYQNH